MNKPDTPIWVRALDAAAITALLFAAFVFLFGGFAIHLSLTPLRINSSGRLLFIAAALAAIRHAAHPAAPLHTRLARVFRALDDRPAAGAAALALSTRLAVLFLGYMAVLTIGVNGATGFDLSPDKLLNLPARFDSGWYAGIALDGYSFGGSFGRQENIAFFPAFPLLMRAAGYPLGAFGAGMPRELRLARLVWAGVTLSVLAFAWAGAYLWRLARDTIGDARAAGAVALLAAYPFAVFFSAAYTESLFLLGSVACVYHYRREEWLRAGAWGLLVGLTRPNGCFLSVVLACLVAERWWKERKISTFPHSHISKSLLAAAMPGIGMLVYSAYARHLTGRFFGWARLHEAWGRSYSGLAPVEQAYGRVANDGLLHVIQGVPFDTLNSLGLIFALAMIWPVLRRLGPALALFVAANILPPLLAGGVLSMGRLTATLFPIFLALAATAAPRTVTAFVIAFAAGQGLAAALFFTWRPLF
jgi:Mannosyltransferase (PIG-V)